MKIVFLVNDGLFEHFLINKVVKTSKYVELKISKYHSELMGTCSFERAIVCIHTYKVQPIFLSNQNIRKKRGLVGVVPLGGATL